MVVLRHHFINPFLMLNIPPDCPFDAFLKLEGWLPAKFVLEFGRVDGISNIVPGTVLDKSDEAEALTYWSSEKSIYRLDHNLYEINILPFVETSDIVCVSRFPFVEDQIYSSGVIFYIKPVTDILSLSIDRERLSISYIIDKQRNKLLWELIWCVVVRSVSYDCRHAVSVMECTYKMI